MKFVLRNSVISLGGRVVGLVVDLLIIGFVGVNAAADAFYWALALPTLLFSIASISSGVIGGRGSAAGPEVRTASFSFVLITLAAASIVGLTSVINGSPIDSFFLFGYLLIIIILVPSSFGYLVRLANLGRFHEAQIGGLVFNLVLFLGLCASIITAYVEFIYVLPLAAVILRGLFLASRSAVFRHGVEPIRTPMNVEGDLRWSVVALCVVVISISIRQYMFFIDRIIPPSGVAITELAFAQRIMNAFIALVLGPLLVGLIRERALHETTRRRVNISIVLRVVSVILVCAGLVLTSIPIEVAKLGGALLSQNIRPGVVEMLGVYAVFTGIVVLGEGKVAKAIQCGKVKIGLLAACTLILLLVKPALNIFLAGLWGAPETILVSAVLVMLFQRIMLVARQES